MHLFIRLCILKSIHSLEAGRYGELKKSGWKEPGIVALWGLERADRGFYLGYLEDKGFRLYGE